MKYGLIVTATFSGIDYYIISVIINSNIFILFWGVASCLSFIIPIIRNFAFVCCDLYFIFVIFSFDFVPFVHSTQAYSTNICIEPRTMINKMTTTDWG